MKMKPFIRAGLPWLAGAVLFVLRLIQLRTGFDPETGLALPTLAGRALWLGLLACLAAGAVCCLRRPGGGKRSYACCFRPPEGALLGAMIAGSFLLIAGGALLLSQAFLRQGVSVMPAAAGALGIAGGGGFLLLVRELRGGGTPAVFPLLPGMFFSVLFVLAVYFPAESDPVLDRFYVPVLGAAMAAYFLYQLSGFTHREGNLRWFSLVGNFAAVTCVAAAADCTQAIERLPVYLGFAVLATVFLLLLREEPLPEPEEPAEGEREA